MDNTLDLIKAAGEGDRAARQQILSENTGLIWSVVRKFLNRGYEADDLFQLGAIGLLKCIDKFDLSYSVKFSTYAVPMIMGEIKRFMRDDGMIKVSRTLKETARKAKYAQERFIKKNGRSPTMAELSAEIETDAEDIIMALESNFEVESLYKTIHQGDGAQVYLIDRLDQSESEYGKITDIIALKEIIKNLKPKERQVIMLRYFRDKTQAEVAKAVGVSQVQVSRIEKKVLGRIREELG